MRPRHKAAHPDCLFEAANWGECDKARDVGYADWQAMQQVILAYRIVGSGSTKAYRKEKTAFARLIRWVDGQTEDIMNDDGNPSEEPFVNRLRAARARYQAGDLPRYNLYTPPSGGI